MRADVFVPADELHMYRSHTLGLLRRYFRMSLQLGRLPALLGREIFRARVTTYRSASFEDLVIFVADVEHCLAQLGEKQQHAIARVVFQEYTLAEAAGRLCCNERTVRRLLASGLDRLSEIFLRCGVLRPFPLHEKACQAPKTLLAMASC
jgi:AraC-like DNA-binding protein